MRLAYKAYKIIRDNRSCAWDMKHLARELGITDDDTIESLFLDLRAACEQPNFPIRFLDGSDGKHPRFEWKI